MPSPKKEEKGILPSSSYQAGIILTLKPNKNSTRKENYEPITPMNINTKILNTGKGTLI